MRSPGLTPWISALALVAALPTLACNGDAPMGSASDGSSTTEATSSSTTVGESTTDDATTTTTTTTGETTTTTGEACDAGDPFTQNVAKDADTYGTCGLPFFFYAKRKAGTATVERCADEACGSCDAMIGYELDTGSTFAVPEEVCLQIAHETVDLAGECTTRALTMWRLDQAGSPPILAVTGVSPEAPESLDPPTLTVALGAKSVCTCEGEPWCCMGTMTSYALDFTVEGSETVSVAPGFANFKNIDYAGASYEVVVTQSLEATACGQDLHTGWYMRRL